MSLPVLPVDTIIPEIRLALQQGKQVVLQASPGAGKTTRVPLSLLSESWFKGKGLLMLEPRRLAAKVCAAYMAAQLGEPVGETIGYCIRLERAAGRKTRIEVVTEGVLTRRLQEDPGLEGIGLVIFDEFHERSIHADLGLALVLDVQQHLRPDLRLMIMSATMEGERISALLSHPHSVVSYVPGHPVEIRYLPQRSNTQREDPAERAIDKALREGKGDVLVFLPGEREIHRLCRRLEERYPHGGLVMAPLYGRLPVAQQQMALQPSPAGIRKVVLATPVAETSLTIEGIQTVVDTGWQRIPQTDRRTGLGRLTTVRISQSSAEQRRGRAGRTAPGVCYRLWSEAEQRRLIPFSTPEILNTDLAGLALELALWGVDCPEDLLWLDVPPREAFEQSQDLLRSLEALDRNGKATSHGRHMARLGTHPRLAHMMIRAREQHQGATACALAALLGERDIPHRKEGGEEADMRSHLELFEEGTSSQETPPGFKRGAFHSLRLAAKRWQAMLGIHEGQVRLSDAGQVLALAYPERIAQRRPASHTKYLLRNGQGAVLPGIGTLCGSEYIVVASLEGRSEEVRIFLAAPLTKENLYRQFSSQMVEERVVGWDSPAQAVTACRKVFLGKLVVQTGPLDDLTAVEQLQAMLQGIRQEGLAALPWGDSVKGWLARLNFLRRIPEENGLWPDFSEEVLMTTLEHWLGPDLEGARRWDDLRFLDWATILERRLDPGQSWRLREQAPTHVLVPSGSRLRLEYRPEGPPILAVRIQELFGCTENPVVAGGRIPVLLHLLSPAGRPVQITQDLAGFWRSGYAEVRKELQGRYPRHPWPKDPLAAVPTCHAKKRRH